jgi:hypothetical protein
MTDVIQGSELLSSFVARQVMIYAFKVDVTAIGLDEMREYPELGMSTLDRPVLITDRYSARDRSAEQQLPLCTS